MAEYWSGNVTFAGFATKTDFNSIIDASVKAEKFRYNQLEKKEAEYTLKKEQVTGLNSTMVSYKSALQKIDTIGEFLTKTAKSSNDSVLTASVNSSASEGVHTIKVDKLATTSLRTSGLTFNAKDAVVNSSGSDKVFAVTYGGKRTEFTIKDGTTAEDFVKQVNSHPDLSGKIKTSLLDVGGGNYKIQLRGMDLGSAHDITVEDTGNLLHTGADPMIEQVAEDAELTVNGIAFTRSTNSVSDIIDGVTLSLTSVDATEVKLTIDLDEDAILKNAKDFVTATNELRKGFDVVKNYKNEKLDGKVNYSLKSNTQLKSVESLLSGILSGVGKGFYFDSSNANASDPFSTLSVLGIKTVADENSADFGKLVLDENEFKKALAQDPLAVANIFAANGEGRSTSSDVSYESSLVGMGITQPGSYDVKYTSDGTNIDPSSISISGHSASDLDFDAATGMVTVKSGLAKGLAIKLNTTAAGTYDSKILIQQGKIAETVAAVEKVADAETGVFKLMEDRYTKELKETKKKMESELDRLDDLKKRLTQQYARTEKQLSQYKNIQSMLEFQLKSQLNNDD